MGNSLLLPHQKEQMQFIVNYYKMGLARNADSFGILATSVAKELGLTALKKQRIQKKAGALLKTYKEKKEKLERELARLKSAHRRELLDMLTTQQQERFFELFGELDLTLMLFK